jgi:hypothetical protein
LATLSVVPNQQPQQKSEEPTREQPVSGPDQYDELLRRYGLTLIQLVNKTRDSWQWKRRGIVLKALKNKEMLKGNHHIGFYPGTVDSFDAIDEYSTFTGNSDPKNLIAPWISGRTTSTRCLKRRLSRRSRPILPKTGFFQRMPTRRGSRDGQGCIASAGDHRTRQQGQDHAQAGADGALYLRLLFQAHALRSGF